MLLLNAMLGGWLNACKSKVKTLKKRTITFALFPTLETTINVTNVMHHVYNLTSSFQNYIINLNHH